jgi:mRNA interferase MazF
MKKDFSTWNTIKIQTDISIQNINIREGEIRWCRVGINIGNEVLGKGEHFIRPVLIMKKFSSDVFLGIPLSTKIHKGTWFYPIKIDGVEQVLILNQGKLFDRKRLEDKLVEISEDELLLIKRAYCDLILS